MRRSINGPRSASTAASLAIKQGSITRRAVSTDENNVNAGNTGKSFMDDAQQGLGSGPVTARLKLLEKKYAHVLEMQAKFTIMDKWIQQQFGIKLFPSSVVNTEKFAEGNPEDEDNPFYAVYLVIQRFKLLEEKVKRLEARPYEDAYERPTSNYSSAHAFRNFRGKGGSGGVKRTYGGASTGSTPKKAKVVARPAPQPNYHFKPAIKVLPRDPNPASPAKKSDTNQSPGKDGSSSKRTDEQVTAEDIVCKVEPESVQQDQEEAENNATKTQQQLVDADADKALNETEKDSTSSMSQQDKEDAIINETTAADDGVASIPLANEGHNLNEMSENYEPTDEIDGEQQHDTPSSGETHGSAQKMSEEMIQVADIKDETEEVKSSNEDEVLPLDDNTGVQTDQEQEMEVDSEQGEGDEEMDEKPDIQEEMVGEDISGSEASVSSAASASGLGLGPGRPRLSARRQAAAVASSSTAGRQGSEDDKPVMYTARGRRHTVPRRYAEFTGHDNVVSILKSQQRAEKSAGTSGSGRPGRKPGSSKFQDTPPKIKKMGKSTKTPTPKKSQVQTDSDGEDDSETFTPKKKSVAHVGERPECVDALVDRVMARDVDCDGMVVLSENHPHVYVNQQQLVTVIVRANGKATRLTRKMTTLVFEDQVLASASPFGTKYYKDRLPPEPLEAMVDFIADSGFEPHYTKKKIYMIVGQVCNEARAGRVSRKFMQPLETTPIPSTSGSYVQSESEEQEADVTQEEIPESSETQME